MKCTTCSKTIMPIVCVDIDGTLGDYHRHFVDFCVSYFGRSFPYWWDGTGDWEDYLCLTRAEYREAKLAFRQGGQKRTMPTFEGANELTAFIATAAELWITTTRPYNRLDSTDPDTQEFLTRNGIHYDYLLYDDDKYGRLAHLVDPERVVAVLDDLPEQYDRAALVFGPDVPILHNGFHNRSAGQSRTTASNLRQARQMIMERVETWYKIHE